MSAKSSSNKDQSEREEGPGARSPVENRNNNVRVSPRILRPLIDRLFEVEVDLLDIPLVGRILRSRYFQPVIHFGMLAGWSLVIATGFLGVPIGSGNLSIMLVWIAWWAALLILLTPLLGRIWCVACPLPSLAEWISRSSIMEKSQSRSSLGIKWPEWLDNIWLQNAAFFGVALLSPIVLTRPSVTAVVILGMLILPVGLDLTFTSRDEAGPERSGRIFCRYVCPVSGLIALYSMVAPFGMRVRDQELCQKHKHSNPKCKECVAGAGAGTDNPKEPARNSGYGCPWFVYPGGLERNNYCGLCTECIKTCPLDNTTFRFNFRWFADLFVAGKRELDEAFKTFIMLGGAAIYSAVMLGWWPGLKDVGNYITDLRVFNLDQFGIYITLLFGTTLIVIPGLHLVFTWLSSLASGERGHEKTLKEIFVDQAYSLVPMGLFAWIAFCFSFLFVNSSYIPKALNDPFGWGWNLFGLKELSWTPYLTGLYPVLQAVVLIAGLALSIYISFRIGEQSYRSSRAALRSTGVYSIFLTGLTWFFLFLYVG